MLTDWILKVVVGAAGGYLLAEGVLILARFLGRAILRHCAEGRPAVVGGESPLQARLREWQELQQAGERAARGERHAHDG